MVSKIQDWSITFAICSHQFHFPKNGPESLKLVSKMALKKWNTNFRLEHSVHSTPFQMFRCSQKFSAETTQTRWSISFLTGFSGNFCKWWKIFDSNSPWTSLYTINTRLTLSIGSRVKNMYYKHKFIYNKLRTTTISFICTIINMLQNRLSAYRRIFVYIFCLINICASLSDEADKIKPLHTERA